MTREVWITGVGLCTPLGHSLDELSASLFERQCAAFRAVDTQFSSRIPVAAVDDPQLSLVECGVSGDRTVRLALIAAQRALCDADAPSDHDWRADCFVAVGNGAGPSESVFDAYRQLLQTNRLQGLTLLRCLPSSASGAVAMSNGLKGGSQNHNCACSSSTVAIGDAFRAIRHGYTERALVGGTEAPLEAGVLKAWEALRVLAPAADNPATACRPFDQRRKGIVLGEGAAFFLLESAASARIRGATPLARISGYGTSSDAHHWTEPDAQGQKLAMNRALADANVLPSEIGAVNAHGTGTQVGDTVELNSLSAVFGQHAVAVTSTKSWHGHLLGASGAIELAVCLASIRRGLVPHTRNLDAPQDAGRLVLVRHEPRPLPLGSAILSNTFAFGGSNACLVLEPVS